MTVELIDYTECFKVIESFEYFLDKYVWIEDKATQEPIKLTLWDSQREKIKDLFSYRLITILKAHQLGYTWIFVAAYCLWRALTEQMHHIVINSFNEDVGAEILKRVHFIMNRLDPVIKSVPIGTSNTQILEFIHIDDNGTPAPSVIQVIPATEKGAQSKTPTILVIDESCQNRYVRKTYTASKPGIDTGQGQIIIISNSIKDAPGWGFTKEIYVNSMKGANIFHRVFLPWQANPNRPANFKQIQLQEGMTEDDFKQRYPETEAEAISAMSGSYFGNTLGRHEKTLVGGDRGHLVKDKGELEFQEDSKGIIEIWRYPYHMVEGWDQYYWEGRYAIGSDISEGLGQSYSVAYVIDRLLDEFVCGARSNRLDAVQWAKVLYRLSQFYASGFKRGGSENALICAERTGAGLTTVKELLKINDANQYVELVAGKRGSPVTRRFGWSESESSKHELCGDLKNWFRVTKGGFYCSTLLEEASHTIKHEGSRKIGPEDDTLMWDSVVAAGCAIQASQFLEGPPKKIIPPQDGWLGRWQRGE